MSDASLHLIALALFAEINARIDCGESRQMVLSEKGLTEPEFQQEQQRWLQLLADQAQQQQWQLQQRYSAAYAQWRFRSNTPEPPPQVLRTDTLPFGPPAGRPLFTSGLSPTTASPPNAPFALPAIEAKGDFGGKPHSPTPHSPTPYSPTASRATPPYFASPVTPATVSSQIVSPAQAFTSPASPAVTSPPAPRAPAPRWDEPDSDGPSFFTAEELAARRSAAPGLSTPVGQAYAQPSRPQNALGQNALGQNALGQNALGQNALGQNALGQNAPDQLGQSRWSAKPRPENAYDNEPSFYTPAEQAARPGESASFFTTAERQVRSADTPRAEAQPPANPNPQPPGATGYFTSASQPAAPRIEAPPFFTTNTQPIVSPPAQHSELGRTQAPAFFTSTAQAAAERAGAAKSETERKEPTGFFTSAGNTTAFRAEAPPFFTTSTQPVASPTQQRLDGPAQPPIAQGAAAPLGSPQVAPAQSAHAQSASAQVSPAYFTSAGQAAAGRSTAAIPEAGTNPSPAYFTSAGQAAAQTPVGQATEPHKEPTGYFTSVGNTTAFRQEAPPFFTTGTHPVVPASPPRADSRGDSAPAPLVPRDSPHADAAFAHSPAFFTSAGQAAAGRPAVSAPDAGAPSPAYFTSAGQAATTNSGAPGYFTRPTAPGPLPNPSFTATPPFSPAVASPAAVTGYTPAQPASSAMASAAVMPTGTSPVQAFSASGYFTNNPPTGAWSVPQTGAPGAQAPAAMALPPLSFEQLACLTAEVELNPSKATSAIAGYGIDQQSYQAQLQALRVRCEADADLQQRYDRLIQYYRSVVKQR